MSRTFALAAVMGVLLLGADRAAAQDAVLSQMYGAGVHAYFDGDYNQAVNLLTKAIHAGSTDPRCYYYRGLTFLKNGRKREAEQDFAKGASLEMADTSRLYDVSISLERVQGPVRQKLETFRAEARVAAYQREMEEQRQRYGELRRQESRVLLDQATAGPSAGATLPSPPAEAAPGGLIDPFGGAAPAPAAPAPADNATTDSAPAPATPAIPMDDPFGGSASPAASPPTPPTIPEPAAPTTPAAPATPSTAPQTADDAGAIFGALGQSFGGALGLGDSSDDGALEPDPFGGSAQPVDDTEADPFGGTDPFGGSAEPVDDTEADPFGGTDPFGGSAQPVDDTEADPFGGTDPFGGSAQPVDDTEADPFGGTDPFGGDMGSEAATDDGGPDPFGSDPFGASDTNSSTPSASDTDTPEDTDSADPFGSDPFGSDPFAN